MLSSLGSSQPPHPAPPKGPSRTKTLRRLKRHSALLHRSVWLCLPWCLLRCEAFSKWKNACETQENGVRTRWAVIANHSATVTSLRVENLLHGVFVVRWGPLGKQFWPTTTAFSIVLDSHWDSQQLQHGNGNRDSKQHHYNSEKSLRSQGCGFVIP